jgi:hypothetical protein
VGADDATALHRAAVARPIATFGHPIARASRIRDATAATRGDRAHADGHRRDGVGRGAIS